MRDLFLQYRASTPPTPKKWVHSIFEEMYNWQKHRKNGEHDAQVEFTETDTKTGTTTEYGATVRLSVVRTLGDGVNPDRIQVKITFQTKTKTKTELKQHYLSAAEMQNAFLRLFEFEGLTREKLLKMDANFNQTMSSGVQPPPDAP